MSDSSDFPDPFDPNEHVPPKEPFDPAEHFASLGDQPFEPLSEEHVDAPKPVEHALPVEETAPVAPSYTPYTPVTPGKPYQPSAARGIGTALLAGSLMVGSAIGVAFIAGKQLAPAPAATPTAATSSPDAEAKPSPDDSKALTSRVDAIKSDIDGLGKRLDEMQKHLASMPKSDAAPDLKPLEAKIEGLAKRVDSSPAIDPKGIEEKVEKATSGQANLLAKLNAVTAQHGDMAKALAAQTATVAALQSRVKSLWDSRPRPEPTSAAPATTTAPAVNATADADFAKAVDLFKKSQFAQAKDLFTKLEEAAPNDARVWYYAAMSTGFASNQWTGETERLVTKGMSLEKAGTPDLAKINATFADLDPGAKGWLDTYRSRISR